MKLRVVIADDEPLARERLRGFLEGDEEVEIVGECSDGTEAVNVILERTPDLVFLDVQMPGLDGFGVVQKLAEERLPAIIFVTAHDSYALRAFEARALDYLLKPFDRERLQQALDHARNTLRRDQNHQAVKEIGELLSGLRARQKPVEHVTVKSAGRFSFVKISQIDWIRGAGNYVELHVGASVHLLRETLASLEGRLPATQFVRISRSLLVNLDRIKELRTKSHGDYLVVMQDGIRLTASRAFRQNLQRLL